MRGKRGPARRRFTIVAGFTVVALALGGALTPAVAQAEEAPLNAAAAYAVNVPSDVLAAAGTTTTTAALAASNQTYDWKLADPKFATVSGASNRYPTSASTTLTPAEQLEWESTNLSGWSTTAPLQAFQVVLDHGDGTADYSAIEQAKEIHTPSPTRKLRCEMWLYGGKRVSAESEPFTEQDDTLPRLNCPKVSALDLPLRQDVWEEWNDGSQQQLLSNDTTAAYRTWSQTLLFKDGLDCFRMADADECDGWVTDPNRDSTYTCYVGTQKVALSQCFIYGQLFNADNRAGGHAYADPTTGGPIGTQTSRRALTGSPGPCSTHTPR